MKTEIQIRTSQSCPTCQGSGEEENPFYVKMREAQDAWEKANGYDLLTRMSNKAFDHDTYRKAEVEWGNVYLREKGCSSMSGQFVMGPWDVRECDNCGGTGTEERIMWVEAEKFIVSMMAQTPFATSNNSAGPPPLKSPSPPHFPHRAASGPNPWNP